MSTLGVAYPCNRTAHGRKGFENLSGVPVILITPFRLECVEEGAL